MLTIRQKLLVE